MVTEVRYLLVIAMSLAGCQDAATSNRLEEGEADPSVVAPDREKAAPRAVKSPPSLEEQRRRAEAVRRAAVELSLKGIRTDGYLMNLIVEDDSYNVAFVKQSGSSLRSEITVKVRREDFEILSVQTPDGAAEP